MTDGQTLKGSLDRLARAADAALRTSLADVAWDELARIVGGEHGVLCTELGDETTDGLRCGILADAECLRASLADARVPGRRAPTAQRRTVKFCQNMRSEIEKLTCALREQMPGCTPAPGDR